MSVDHAVSLHLALHPDTTLWVALFHANDPYIVASKVRDYGYSRFAICDSSRIISLDQIVVAANMALLRRKQEPAAWDVVFAAAGSTHAGHVMRDFAFGEKDSSEPQGDSSKPAMVLGLGLECSLEEFLSVAKQVGLGDPKPLTYFPDQPSDEQTDNFIKWYKLTKEEVEMSSLEKAVLTRLATKYYV